MKTPKEYRVLMCEEDDSAMTFSKEDIAEDTDLLSALSRFATHTIAQAQANRFAALCNALDLDAFDVNDEGFADQALREDLWRMASEAVARTWNDAGAFFTGKDGKVMRHEIVLTAEIDAKQFQWLAHNEGYFC